MADRTVKVTIKADVDHYVRNVNRAAAATDRLAARASQRHAFDVDTSAAVAGLGRLDRSLAGTTRRTADLARSIKLLGVGGAVVAGAPQLASLGAAAVTAAGSLTLIPAAAFGAAAGIGALVIGLQGFGDALKQSDPEKFAEAVRELAPSARATAVELRSMADDWRRLQRAVQQELFEGVADTVDDLGREYLPIMRVALSGVADELSDAAVAWGDFATSAETTRDAATGMENIRRATESLAPVMVNLSATFRDVSTVGSTFLPRLSEGLADATGRWAEMVAQARRSGELAEIMDRGIERTGQFARVLGDTAGLAAGVFRAAEGAGFDFLGTLERLTEQAHAFVDSSRGRDDLERFFRGLGDAVDAFVPGLRELAGLAATVIQNLAQSGTLVAAGDAFSALAREARPVLEMFSELASNVLPPLLGAIERLAPLLGPAAAGFVALKLARTGLRLGNLAGEVGALNRVLPGLAMGLGVAAAAYQEIEVSADDLVEKVRAGALSAEEARTQFLEAEKGARLLAKGIPFVGDAFALFSDDVRDLDAALLANEQAQAAVERAMLRADGALKGYKRTVEIFGADSPEAISALAAYEGAVDDVEQAQADAGIATDGHTRSVERQREVFLDSIQTEIRWKDAVDAAARSIEENGRVTDLNTEAGRRNQEALLRMAQAAYDDIEAKAANGASTEAITRLVEGHERQLFNTARQMGFSEEAARDYVAQLGLVPTSQTTTFSTPGLDEAREKVEGLAYLLGTITGEIKTNVNPGGKFTPGSILRRATGGPIHGPGTGTSDSIPALLSNGEHVWTAREVQAAGGHRAVEEMRAQVARGYARGGPVRLDVALDFAPVTRRANEIRNEMFPPQFDLIPGMGGFSGGRGVERWRPLVQQMLRLTGNPVGYDGITLRRMNQESGGNPRAINLWDINARRGIPSKGLMQVIDPTFRAYRHPALPNNIWDPAANIAASMRYAVARYGNLPRAFNRRGGYDEGGIARGTGYMPKNVIAPERVLSPRQTVAFERLIDVLDRPRAVPIPVGAATSEAGTGGKVINIQPGAQNTIRETVDVDLLASRLDFAIRSAVL